MLTSYMNERGPRRQPRVTVDDPYAKPWVARDAAKNVVKDAIRFGHTPGDLIDQMHGIFRPNYTAVVGRCKFRFRSGPGM